MNGLFTVFTSGEQYMELMEPKVSRIFVGFHEPTHGQHQEMNSF